MRRTLFTIALCTLLALACGCSKHKEKAGPRYLLTKITDESGYSTQFEYDAQNRIQTIINYDDNGALYATGTLSYGSNGEITSWAGSLYGSPNTTTYSKSGNKITIDDNGDIYTLDLNSRGLPAKQSYLHENGDNWYQSSNNFTYQGSNLTATVGTWEEEWNGNSYSGGNTTTFTYDNRKALFSHCKTPQWWLVWYYWGDYGIQNNPITRTWVSDESDPDNTTIEYTYNEDGFPVTATWTWDGDELTETYLYNTPSSITPVAAAPSGPKIANVQQPGREKSRHGFGRSAGEKQRRK